jgi:hypothetical protein
MTGAAKNMNKLGRIDRQQDDLISAKQEARRRDEE